DLEGATMVALLDAEESWPLPGNLRIDNFTYNSFGSPQYPSPRDARSRLKWLSLQPRYYPQPYQQLAKVLRSSGDEVGAVQVMIAAGDARYAQYGPAGRAAGWFLRVTTGYGHRPLLAIYWSVAVVLVGWMIVGLAKRAGVMRLTWPETTPL